MANGNGKTAPITPSEMDTKTLLEVLVEAVKQLTEIAEEQKEAIIELKEINVELLEKVNNLTLEGDGFGIED